MLHDNYQRFWDLRHFFAIMFNYQSHSQSRRVEISLNYRLKLLLLPRTFFLGEKIGQEFFAPRRGRRFAIATQLGHARLASSPLGRRAESEAKRRACRTLASLRPRPSVRPHARQNPWRAGPASRRIHSSSFRSSWRSDVDARGTRASLRATVNDQRQADVTMSVIAVATRGEGRW